MQQRYSLLLLVAILGCIDGLSSTNQESVTSVPVRDNSGSPKATEARANTVTASMGQEERGPSPLMTELSSMNAASPAIANLRETAVASTSAAIKKPNAFQKFYKNLKAISIKGDVKGMVVAYSVAFLAFIAICAISYSLFKHNQETIIH